MDIARQQARQHGEGGIDNNLVIRGRKQHFAEMVEAAQLGVMLFHHIDQPAFFNGDGDLGHKLFQHPQLRRAVHAGLPVADIQTAVRPGLRYQRQRHF